MSITFRILGKAGQDNAMLVQIDSGQAVERLLFDCGDGCLSEVALAEIWGIDQLLFSHLHMDHIGGFDTFFRGHFESNSEINKPNHIWGPPDSARILQHRFQGFLWNLYEEMAATWIVSEIHSREIRTVRFELGEAFAKAHDAGVRRYDRIFLERAGFFVEAVVMDHRTTSLAYVIREKARRNVNLSRLTALGLRPGPWLKQLKESTSASGNVVIGGIEYSLAELLTTLIGETPGEAVAYLTDFLLDEAAMERLVPALRGCRTIVCEAKFRHADLELARKNYHMTTVLAATLAQRAGVKELILFHLSDRYRQEDWLEMLAEAKQIFPNTRYPSEWNLGQ
jgi:ribonuclease Z